MTHFAPEDERLAIQKQGALASIALSDGTRLPLLQILGIGRNYAEHAHERGAARPERPLVFTKNPSSVILDGEPIVIPRACAHEDQVDYEGELAIVLGSDARDLCPQDVYAPDGPVLGYCIANDVSARWWQRDGAGGQFYRGKSFDTFCPLGPWITPTRFVENPQALIITTTLSGERVQYDSTQKMLFPIASLLVELTRSTTLPAGTVILTGTPAGVGAGKTPPRFLRSGDTVSVEVTGLGTVSNPIVA